MNVCSRIKDKGALQMTDILSSEPHHLHLIKFKNSLRTCDANVDIWLRATEPVKKNKELL